MFFVFNHLRPQPVLLAEPNLLWKRESLRILSLFNYSSFIKQMFFSFSSLMVNVCLAYSRKLLRNKITPLLFVIKINYPYSVIIWLLKHTSIYLNKQPHTPKWNKHNPEHSPNLLFQLSSWNILFRQGTTWWSPQQSMYFRSPYPLMFHSVTFLSKMTFRANRFGHPSNPRTH